MFLFYLRPQMYSSFIHVLFTDMYPQLLAVHSALRWLVLIFLLYAIYRAYTGFTRDRQFTRTDNAFRHWTATIAHIQLVVGIVLYTQSPVIYYFWANKNAVLQHMEPTFYSLVHAGLMLAAIVTLTVGSAMAKRRTGNREKFRTLLIWFSVALLLICIAIPWPFSPLSVRPYFRSL